MKVCISPSFMTGSVKHNKSMLFVKLEFVMRDGKLTFKISLCVCLVLGKVRSAVGSAQLLMSKKFKQFQGLCEQNLVSMNPSPDS